MRYFRLIPLTFVLSLCILTGCTGTWRIDPAKVSGLFFNVRFDENTFTLTTGTAVSDFSVMRSVGDAWDRLTLKFFQQHQIDLEAL